MLHTNKTQLSADPELAPADFAPSTELLGSFATFVRRQYPVILCTVLLILAFSVVYLLTTPPSFTGQAMMIIDTRRAQPFQQQPNFTDFAIDSASVDSQVEILKSENVALAVIKELHLTEDPEFVGPSSGLIGALTDFFSQLFGFAEPKSEFELTRRAAEVFADRLGVKRVHLTYIIEIYFRSLDAERAAQIVNAIADAYVVDQLDAKYQATRRASKWLQDRILELREQASTAERAVVEFKTKNNIVDTGGRLMNEQQLAELNSQLVIARAQTGEARARLDRIEAVIRADSPDASVTATVADTLKNDVVTKLRTQYFELANREADWSARYGRNHLAAMHLRSQMRELRNSILDELKRMAETYKSDYEIAKQREESIDRGLSNVVSQSQVTNQAQVTLRDLESSSQTYRALYDNFLQRYMESVQQQSFPISEARLITPASRPLKKSHPKTLLILVIATMGGGVLGLGIAALRDFWDRVFRTREQVEATLQADCIAMVPVVKAEEAKPATAVQRSANAASGPRTIAREQNLFWHVVDFPLSRFAESIRSIKVAADLGGARKSRKVIGLTSALPNEGKSTISVAFAQLMAQAGARVILVDCDLRNPWLTRALAHGASIGLLEVVSGKAALRDAIWTDRSTNLTFLPAVVKSRFAHTNEIIASDAMKALFDRMLEEFDYVVVDLSPMAPVVDVRSSLHFVDSYVVVIEWGKTRLDVVERAFGMAPGVHESLLGIVLNKVDFNLLGRYDGYGSGYYHNKYYAKYGYTD